MITYWILFNAIILILLLVDLFLIHPKSKVISLKESLLWSLFWIACALLFNLFIYFTQGEKAAGDFFAGYLIEKSLSIDNLFVFILIFETFNTPSEYVHKTLFYGVIGAIILRGIFIALGVTLIGLFHQILYILGIFLIYSGLKLLFNRKKKLMSQENALIRLCRKVIPVTDTYHSGNFFVKKGRRIYATPLFLTLVAIELTDVMFAFDSIPAIFAITLDPFIVYTSNIFAILGLRSLYFALAHLISLFQYLHYAISLLLILAGLKILLRNFIEIPLFVTLGTIFVILTSTIIISLIMTRGKKNIK